LCIKFFIKKAKKTPSFREGTNSKKISASKVVEKRTVGHTGIACGVRHKSKVLVENNVVDCETRILFL